MNAERSVWVGYDPREADAFAVARSSAKRHLSSLIPVHGLVLSELIRWGLYKRPTVRRDGCLWDKISDAPMSTEFACSRFLIRHLAHHGWALFMDGDVLVRKDLNRLFDLADESKAVMVVKHDHNPASAFKMDGQLQTNYARKNWSSVMLLNCDHEANDALTWEMINSVPGRELHAFKWLSDDLIGELPAEWNWLVGHSSPDIDPSIVHFTEGYPSLKGHEGDQFADEWRAELTRWAA